MTSFYFIIESNIRINQEHYETLGRYLHIKFRKCKSMKNTCSYFSA